MTLTGAFLPAGKTLGLGMFWYEDEVKRLEHNQQQMVSEPETIFYGSSSIRQWVSLEKDFADLKPVNLGFGGSTLAACVWFFERIMVNYKPKKLIIYAGDNDLGDGRHPEEVFIFFQQLTVRATQRFGNIPCYYISLKPSPSRWHLADHFKFANTLIEHEIANHLPTWRYIDLFDKMLGADGLPKKEYFLNDGLHLSTAGYQLWTDIIKKQI
ncbi:MAG TPA: GDSL-type esterase/lipase family protein [Mucilaginibacter sp.]